MCRYCVSALGLDFDKRETTVLRKTISKLDKPPHKLRRGLAPLLLINIRKPTLPQHRSLTLYISLEMTTTSGVNRILRMRHGLHVVLKHCVQSRERN